MWKTRAHGDASLAMTVTSTIDRACITFHSPVVSIRSGTIPRGPHASRDGGASQFPRPTPTLSTPCDSRQQDVHIGMR